MSRTVLVLTTPVVENFLLRAVLLHQCIYIHWCNAYILVDAPDEYTNPEILLEFVKALMGWSQKNLHVLTTSRKENAIATSLCCKLTCEMTIQMSPANPLHTC